MECVQIAQVASTWEGLKPAWEGIKERDDRAKAKDTRVEGLPTHLPAGRERPVLVREGSI